MKEQEENKKIRRKVMGRSNVGKRGHCPEANEMRLRKGGEGKDDGK